MLNKLWLNTSLIVRITLVLVALMIGTSTLFVGTRTAMAASLKSVSIINNDTLTLGDIFNGVKHNSSYVIGRAPQPGEDMVLNARTLYRIAVALDLSWRPSSSNDQIIVRREATVVSYDTIKDALINELKNKGVQGKFNIELNNGKPSITLPKDLPDHVEISSLRYEGQKDYFQATLVSPSIDNPVEKMIVSGMIERMASVPVLRINLKQGDIIGANDIDFIDIPQKTLKHNVILNKDDLIGLTPRRIAYAGKVILAETLERPQLVERGTHVHITFKEGPLILTAKGKALQSGAKGDLVRVTNINSSRTIDAYITGSGQVVVR